MVGIYQQLSSLREDLKNRGFSDPVLYNPRRFEAIAVQGITWLSDLPFNNLDKVDNELRYDWEVYDGLPLEVKVPPTLLSTATSSSNINTDVNTTPTTDVKAMENICFIVNENLPKSKSEKVERKQ